MATSERAAPLHVVGIGASAGGLDPIERFFDNLPCDTGMAFVLVQHLSPDFRSLMDELLARHTDMPIQLVEDGMAVEPNHVYLLPPKKEMVIAGGRLLLSNRAQHELALPIDAFFRSLAQDCGPRSVAIVLSGGGTDGSRGIRDVRQAGGLVIVQDTDSAQFDGMPKTAREAGVAHWVLAPQEMPAALLEHQKFPTAAATPARDLATIYHMLQREFGLDFTHYKPTTVTRRIERRLALASSPNLDEYIARLQRDKTELDVLYRDLLIGVTSFFRDPAAFDLLEQRILPDLLAAHASRSPLRIWVAGCATGEEAYSIAIVLLDLMARMGEVPVKIFATDVHRGSLDRATRGIYPAETVTAVSPERLERYFVRVGDTVQVSADVRQMVVFAAHDVIKDAPFTRVDLISCRNMLIYLTPSVQQRVLGMFHFALNRSGVVLLGPSESPGGLAEDFECLDKHWKIYRKRNDTHVRVDLPRPAAAYADARTVLPSVVHAGRATLPHLLATYDSLLDQVMPPSLLVNEQGELLHVFGGASRFLRSRDGRQGPGLLESVEGELHMLLTGALKRAFVESSPIVFRGVRIDTNGKGGAYTVTVRQIPARSPASAHALVSLEAAEPSPTAAKEINLDDVSRPELARLESELSHTKESLQSAIEELQSTNEEFQASNEELQVSNEELQSTNEELQSVNEELYTVNAEYQRKITELTELTNDMENLLASTEVGTIFLDRSLIIRKFTPQIAETFSLMPQDVGRSIETFTHRLDHPELVGEMRIVAETGAPFEHELRDKQGKSFFLRILPYRARGKSDGVVVTIIDVSTLKAAEDALFHERYLLNSLLRNVPDAVYFKDAGGRFIRVNPVMSERLGLSDPSDAVGKTAAEVPYAAAALRLEKSDDEVMAHGQSQRYCLEQYPLQDGSEAWELATRLALRDAPGAVVGVAGILRDVTDQKRAEDHAKEAVRRRDQFLAMLSHELRNPLGALVNATTVLRRGAGADSGARALDVLDRQSEQMARLLDDLLEVSRVTQGKIELRTVRVDLQEAVERGAEMWRDQLARVNSNLTIVRGEGALRVDIDLSRLEQVLANLLGNAVKYAAGGDVTVVVAREDASAVIRVRDTGPGIPTSMLDSVFDLFVQGSRSIARSAGGLGVGLTLVRSLIALHGGTVSVANAAQGTGCEFIVMLPLASGPEPVAAEEKRRETPVPRAGSARRAKVVVVEDNADNREMLSELLGIAGYECHTAESGPEALALISRVEPTIAIVDIGLPGMDGYALARHLRADPRHERLWLIALTGYGQITDRAASRAAGFDEHLVKPLPADTILQRLAEREGTSHGSAVTDTVRSPRHEDAHAERTGAPVEGTV